MLRTNNETFEYKLDRMHTFYHDKEYKKTDAYKQAKSVEHAGQVMQVSPDSWICTEEEPLQKKLNQFLQKKIFYYYQQCIKSFLQEKRIKFETYLCENGESYYFQFPYADKTISIRVSNHDEGRSYNDKTKARFHHIHFRVDETNLKWAKQNVKKKVYADMEGCLHKQHCKLMNRLYKNI